MSLVTSADLLNRAMAEGYAVPAFNANSYDMIPALIHAAEKERSPLILQIGKKYLGYTSADDIAALSLPLAERAAVPVSIHLDHGAGLAMALECLRCGFTSIMYDGSTLPDEENINNTRQIVLEAERYGVPVEGEIGQVLLADEIQDGAELDFLTDPMQARNFVQKTGVASVAVAVGNIHRMQKKQARLDFERITKLRSMIEVPLVIHGCSGVSDDDIRRAVALGINKVNVATEYNIAFTDTLRDFTAANPTEFFPMDCIRAAMNRVYEIARERIRVLGADNRY